MTDAERDRLTEHRLKTLEDLALGYRQTERQTDLLSVAVARFETTLAEVRAEASARDEHANRSLARIHARLDELTVDEAREDGARAERSRLGRLIVVAVATSSSAAGAISALIALVVT